MQETSEQEKRGACKGDMPQCQAARKGCQIVSLCARTKLQQIVYTSHEFAISIVVDSSMVRVLHVGHVACLPTLNLFTLSKLIRSWMKTRRISSRHYICSGTLELSWMNFLIP